jgi:hypothetical protein
MDMSQVVGSAIPLLAQYILAPATIVLLVFLLFIYWRSGSSHAVLLKTWLTVFGQAPANSKVIQQFAADELDLTQFKFLTGLRVATIREAERLSIWARERDIHLRLIRKCGKYFDLEKPGLRAIVYALGRRHQAWRFVFFLVFVALLAVLVQYVGYQRAVVTVRATGKDFTVDQQYATPLFRSEKLLFKDCTTASASEHFDTTSIKVLCELNRDPQFVKEAAIMVRQQQLAVALACVYALILALLLCFSMIRIHSAILVRKKIEAYEFARRVSATGSDAEKPKAATASARPEYADYV